MGKTNRQERREVFEKNMTSLSLKYPELATRVAQTEILDYSIFKIDNCVANIQHNIVEEPWYTGKINEWCEKQWKPLKLKKIKKICLPIFLGLGLGYELGYFLQTYGPQKHVHQVIVIEKDIQAFTAAMNTIDLSTIINNDKVHLFVGYNPNRLLIELKKFFLNRMEVMLLGGAMKPLTTQYAMRIGKEYYKMAYAKVIEANWSTLKNFGNDPDDSLIGVENMLDNLNEIVENPGINKLYDKFKGYPAVVVATGPSLKKNMHLLKDIKDKALIFSVDASFHLLMDNGIKPHMVTSLEREHAVEQFFANHDEEEVKDVYMTTCPVLFNHVYKAYNGPKIMVYRKFDHFKWIGIDKGMMNIKLSSSNMAYKIAQKLGCDPIILIGQDLAYGENDETHACDVPFSSAGEDIFHVQGNVKENVKTNSGWWEFLKAYEVDIAENPNGTTINATEGGAYIQGTHIDTFQNAISKYMKDKEKKPLEIIKENLKDFEVKEEEKQMVKEKLLKAENDIQEILNLCIEGKNICEEKNKILSTLDLKKDEEQIRELYNEIVKNRIDITVKYNETFQLLLMHIVQSVHLAFEIELIKNNDNLISMGANYIKWYSKMEKIIKTVQNSLLNAKELLYGNKES
jgi:hypothetical protein